MKSLFWFCLVIFLAGLLYAQIKPMHVYKKAIVRLDIPAVLMEKTSSPVQKEDVSDNFVVKDIDPAEPIQNRQPLEIVYPQKTLPDKALHVYKKPFTHVSDLPLVSIVMVGLGLQTEATQRALAVLPDVVSLSFSFGADNLSDWIVQARQNGFETLFDMPVQSDSFPLTDQGKYVISPLTKAWENNSQVTDLLAKNSAVIGFVSPDAAYMDDLPDYQAFIQNSLFSKGLIYVGRKSVQQDLPVIDSYFNGPFEPTALDAFLDKVLQTAAQNGRTIAVLPANALTLSRLQQWMAVSSSDVEFVPVSVLFSSAEK